MRTAWNLLKGTLAAYTENAGTRLAAALSYYTIFSIAPLLIILLGITGIFFGQSEARAEFTAVVSDQLSPQVADLLNGLIQSTVEGHNQAATVIGIAILLFASTNLFTAMQGALNQIWGVEHPRYKGLLQQIFMRALALLIMLALAVIGIGALTAQTVLTAISDRLSSTVAGFDFLFAFGSQLLTLAVMTLVFVAVHKILVHRRVGWKAVFTGALLTALLFRIGQELILLYLRTSTVSSAFGAAGTLVALLLFIYYAMQIFLLGAAFTRHYAEQLKEGPEGDPKPIRSADTARQRL